MMAADRIVRGRDDPTADRIGKRQRSKRMKLFRSQARQPGNCFGIVVCKPTP